MRASLLGIIIFLVHLFAYLGAWGTTQASAVRLWTDSFVSENYSATATKSFNFMGASYTSAQAEANLGVALNNSLLSYINVSQLYFNYDSRIEVGRKKSTWSQLDARWNFSVWEPVFEWNVLAPERQGLSGIFYNTENEKWEFELMVSPFFIPNQGPGYSIGSNGELERSSPWFSRPPEFVRITSQGDLTPIAYNIQRPRETDVVFQNSVATRLQFKQNGFAAQMAYAMKPMNQLPLAYKGTNNIPADQAAVDITASVQYHELTGLEASWSNEKVSAGVSGLRDRPFGNPKWENAEIWTKPVFHEAFLISPYLDVRFPWGIEVKLQHLQIQGGDVTELGPRAKETPMTQLYPFREAQRVELSYRGLTSLAYTHSLKNKFKMLQWRGQMAWTRQWTVFSEAQLVEAEPASMTNPSEMGEFDNHDRVLVGVGYVF